jgi:hypothetical protein
MATVAQKLAATLKEMGVQYIFGIPGGKWIDYMAAIEAVDGLNFIIVSNESSCGFLDRAPMPAFTAVKGPIIVEAKIDPQDYDGLLLRGNRCSA